jgi:pyruvate ferredoxin oxidoreductase alpha subunit
VTPYRIEGAETIVVALGSVLGTLADTVDELRAEGVPVGVLGLTTFRPFPTAAVAAALAGVERIVVLERAFGVGVGGIVTADLRAAAGETPLWTVVAGLGGRPVTSSSLRRVLTDVEALQPLSFLDLDVERVGQELGS